ncbi:helix-turn-helix transcriptional regulator [Plectonema cf. radiosum LEGE 06105]|uniref:Helix-turn-helix transcriptional regulator n=1 Tax=Plectonema cf. radiosum LEGE 06105 TaxID=945769 RepID=A0A8J7FPI4_9CYAN|nr:helix-turn-helix transcriptional regulator [Plectonema radiosum]MBE9216806.1 helix-turn-helix transcriptional regulator [Plectonema cf. radiosum LEGE 06105]
MDIKKPYCINQPEVGELIRELRISTGLTQEKFAAKLGVTLLTINRWENGRSQPSPLAMEKVEGMLEEIKQGEYLIRKYISNS